MQLSTGFETGISSDGCFIKSTIIVNPRHQMHYFLYFQVRGALRDSQEKLKTKAYHKLNIKGEIFGGNLILVFQITFNCRTFKYILL